MNQAAGDVAVLGAGAIGLAIARELAGRGARVTVYDTGEPARGASWAAAGMLAPRTEGVPAGPFRDLCDASLAAYSAFAAELHEESGVDIHLRLDGIVHVAFDARVDDDQRARAAGDPERFRYLDRQETLRAEPAISPRALGALLATHEGQVDNRRLCRALLVAAERRGVVVRARCEALCIETDQRRVLGVRTALGFAAARAVINATGAFAASIAGVPSHAVPPVRPVKGQMLALAVPDPLVRRTTWIPNAYLVPRHDGRLLVGATVEDAGFDLRTTANGVHALLDAVLRGAPALRDFAVVDTWAGLRPGTPDALPYLGPTALEGYVLATGHFRNGVLLVPATATVIADAIEGRGIERLEPFSLARGTKAGAA